MSGLAGFFLSGCALISGSAVVDLYDISAPELHDVVRGSTRAQILVAVPNAMQALDTNRIAVRTGTATLGYIAGAQWADDLPKLLQAKLVQTFEQSGRVAAVGVPGEGLSINYSIRLNIRYFGLDTDGARRAVVEFSARIVNESNGRVVASRSFDHSVVAGTGTAGAVSALDSAFAQTAQDLAQWMVSKI